LGPFLHGFYFMLWLYKPCLKDAAYEIPLYLDYWFMRRRAFNVFPCISLCQIKRPLVGPILGGFYFYLQSLQTMSQGCCISNIRVFEKPVHKKIFLNSSNFTPFCPLLDPNRCQPLDLCKFESPFPKVASYQIWLKSIQWFWRRSRLKEKFTDDGRTPDGGWYL